MPYKNIEDRRKARMRSYHKHRDKELAYDKEYKKSYKHTLQHYKTHTISNWRARGVIETDQYTFDDLFEAYLYCSECEVCNKTFETRNDKCLDHDHSTGVFRDVVCQRCNAIRRYQDA